MPLKARDDQRSVRLRDYGGRGAAGGPLARGEEGEQARAEVLEEVPGAATAAERQKEAQEDGPEGTAGVVLSMGGELGPAD